MRSLIALTILAFAAGLCVGAEANDAQAGSDLGRSKDGPRVERSTDKDGKITESSYDGQGNLITKKVDVGTPTERAWLYEYSATGQLLSERAPDGTRVLYEYETPASKVPVRAKAIGPDGKECEFEPVTFFLRGPRREGPSGQESTDGREGDGGAGFGMVVTPDSTLAILINT